LPGSKISIKLPNGEMRKVFIIAETGAAHRKSYARCIALIDAARAAGADAVKFSAFKPEEMTLKSGDPPFVITEGPWSGRNLYDLYDEIAIPYEWLPDLRRATKSAGLEFILSVYHPNTVPILAELGVKTVKIASFELNYVELLTELAKDPYVKKILLSTGGGTEKEITAALEILKYKDVVLLYCVSEYPAKTSDMNLVMLEDMRKFGKKLGLSNHTQALSVPLMAVTLGACVIETHIKLDDDNLDASFAVFPDKFAAMVDIVRQAELIMGKVDYDRTKSYHRKKMNGEMLRVVWQKTSNAT